MASELTDALKLRYTIHLASYLNQKLPTDFTDEPLKVIALLPAALNTTKRMVVWPSPKNFALRKQGVQQPH